MIDGLNHSPIWSKGTQQDMDEGSSRTQTTVSLVRGHPEALELSGRASPLWGLPTWTPGFRRNAADTVRMLIASTLGHKYGPNECG